MDEKSNEKDSKIMSKVSEASKKLQKIREEQGDLDFDQIVAEVFDDISSRPDRYYAEYDAFENVPIPRSDSGQHNGDYIVNSRGSVTILGPESPRNPIDLLIYLLSKERRSTKMVHPVPKTLSKSQTKTFEQLVVKLKDLKVKKELKRKVEEFRRTKEPSEEASEDNFITLGGGGSTSRPVPGQIVFNQSGNMMVCSGDDDLIEIKCYPAS